MHETSIHERRVDTCADVLALPEVLAFENAAVDPAAFDHRAHLFVAWCYLCALPLEAAIARYVRHLRALTNALGAPEKFHATITWGYLLLVDEAMHASPGLSFDVLLAQHPTLLEAPHQALRALYDPQVLQSAEARDRFVVPRRA